MTDPNLHSSAFTGVSTRSEMILQSSWWTFSPSLILIHCFLQIPDSDYQEGRCSSMSPTLTCPFHSFCCFPEVLLRPTCSFFCDSFFLGSTVSRHQSPQRPTLLSTVQGPLILLFSFPLQWTHKNHIPLRMSHLLPYPKGRKKFLKTTIIWNWGQKKFSILLHHAFRICQCVITLIRWFLHVNVILCHFIIIVSGHSCINFDQFSDTDSNQLWGEGVLFLDASFAYISNMTNRI